MSTKAAVSTPLTSHVKIELQDSFALSIEARLAFDLCSRISFATAEIDGEDSAGGQKVRLLNPSEVAARACQITEHLLASFSARDWLVPLPDLDGARAAWKEQVRKEEEAYLSKRGRTAIGAFAPNVGISEDRTVPTPAQPA